jgi:hypothetical protein
MIPKEESAERTLMGQLKISETHWGHRELGSRDAWLGTSSFNLSGSFGKCWVPLRMVLRLRQQNEG